MYCRAIDHDTEDCPTLLGKIQEKNNHNNQNVQWISTKARDDGRNINIVTRGGGKTETDTIKNIQHNTNGLRRILSHISSLMHKKKETFKEARHEFLKKNVASTSGVHHAHNLPMYEIPSSMDHTSEGQPLEKVSTIKTFLQSCIKLFNDQSYVKVLQDMLEICNTMVEGKLEQNNQSSPYKKKDK
jgi:hypothetical protein